jgi:integrase
MLNNGRNFIEVSKMLGHSQPSTTMNTYAHLIPVIHNDIGDFMDELVTPISIEIGETSKQTTVEAGK